MRSDYTPAMLTRLTILGSGTSHGVPMIGCNCPTCTSDDPHDKRTRASAVFGFDGCNVLIDTGPELRLQCVACGLREVHAILFTHHHADHVVGLDDVRVFNRKREREIVVYGSRYTLERVERMFPYAFRDDPDYPSVKPRLRAHPIDGPFELSGRRIVPIPLLHGELGVLGFRAGRIAYCTDCSRIPDESHALLEDLDVLILDAVRNRPHPTHFNLEEAIEAARRIGARLTYFTHIAHALRHAEVNRDLPQGMALAYDGLVCESDRT